MPLAPDADRFLDYPASWYLFCTLRDLRRGPLSRDAIGRRLVAFRTAAGRVAVMDAPCAHLGADLGRGCVMRETLRCSFHHWEYAADGRCIRIPAGADVPPWARQRTYPAVERHGLVFFFNGPEPRFPLPFFADARPEDLVAARPFGAVLACPWFLVGANGFDLQHFRVAHGRVLVGEPVVDRPSPFARRGAARFAVSGNSVADRLTRCFAGGEVAMSSTDWCGTLAFTTASFRRTRSYGMVAVEPLGPAATRVRVVVFVRRSRWAAARALIDPVNLALRRLFILLFLKEDVPRLNGIQYNPSGLIEMDCHLGDYLNWLAEVAHGQPGAGAEDARLAPALNGRGGKEGR